MIIRDKYGWPVTKIKGRPITNFFRMLIHGNIKRTFCKDLSASKMIKAMNEGHAKNPMKMNDNALNGEIVQTTFIIDSLGTLLENNNEMKGDDNNKSV